mmetsp:Transcript_8578/g.12113  ORF Transcript_8578/g.12113 Transcript_8578/m.12113 type:complete len:101 (+) Transcript_8578:910-1212(+)
MNNLQMPGSISGVISGAGSGQIAMQETDVQVTLNTNGVSGRSSPSGSVRLVKAGIADLPIFASLFPGPPSSVGVLGLDFLANAGPQKKLLFSAVTRTMWI